jgi:hypothetical protein
MPRLTPWRMVANYAQMSSQLLLRSGVQEGIVSLKELVGRKDLSLLAPKPRQFYGLVQLPVSVSPAVSVVERMFAVIITFVFSHGTLAPHLSFPLVTQNRSAD